MALSFSVASELLVSLLSPATCAACGQRVERRSIFCAPCARSLEPAPRGPVRAPFAYGGALSQAITRFKYEDRPHLARPLAQLLLRLVPELRAEGVDRVVPVPLHPARLAERGFNPPALLARPVAKALGAPWSPLGLRRLRDTPRQANLDRRLRLANVRGAFEARAGLRRRARPPDRRRFHRQARRCACAQGPSAPRGPNGSRVWFSH